MTEVADQQDPSPRKSRLPLITGAVLAVTLGAAGFYAAYSGMLPLAQKDAGAVGLPALSYVTLEPVLISLGDASDRQHLRFRAELEVAPQHKAEVELLQPRILDVLNSYLRAVSVEDLEDPAHLVRLRAQMLRRVQIVTGEGRVRDLLVTEFVLN
ncbi:flagellar basal body-associated FliL family protein [Falsirhodobacter deserti]|uniref:flagellar basal body-associated FliL family protein n=1 Tax=Falsirhodobacter deserti TaxID=1365611 RepID=UPI000FE2C8BB|nr:flagellar basal body-associated FliL family protein [Falsirhodobacter deserti]